MLQTTQSHFLPSSHKTLSVLYLFQSKRFIFLNNIYFIGSEVLINVAWHICRDKMVTKDLFSMKKIVKIWLSKIQNLEFLNFHIGSGTKPENHSPWIEMKLQPAHEQPANTTKTREPVISSDSSSSWHRRWLTLGERLLFMCFVFRTWVSNRMKNKLKNWRKRQGRNAPDFRVGSTGYNNSGRCGAGIQNAKVGMHGQQMSEHQGKKNTMTKKWRKQHLCIRAKGEREVCSSLV